MNNAKHNATKTTKATGNNAATTTTAVTTATATPAAASPAVAHVITRCTIQQKPSVPATAIHKLSDHNARANSLRAMLLDLLLSSKTLEEAYGKSATFRGRTCFVTNIDTNFAVKRGYLRLEVPKQEAATQAPIVQSPTAAPEPAKRGKVAVPAVPAAATVTTTATAEPKPAAKRTKKTA